MRDSYWLVPSLMAASAALLSWWTVWLDTYVSSETVGGISWIYITGTEGSRTLLSTIAGSMMTVTGVVFSMTTVALSLASQQLGPRILRNFMQDKGNQIVLGTFIATFLYCILVLRTIHETGEEVFVPRLSLLCAVGLAMASLGVLIYFIHHVAKSIQAPTVIQSVGRSFLTAIEELYPGDTGKASRPRRPGKPEEEIPSDFEGRSVEMLARNAGYLQAIDIVALARLAEEQDLLLRLEARPGHFLFQNQPLVRVYPEDRLTKAVRKKIDFVFVIGGHRTPTQDIEFTLDQLVEVAVRALSPGINDPFTALSCVDWLGAGLSELAQKEQPATHHYNEAGQLRMITSVASFEGLADAALNQLRQHSHHDVAVTCRLLEIIARIVNACPDENVRNILTQHAAAIHRNSLDWTHETDKLDADRRVRAVMDRLSEADDAAPPSNALNTD
jgi:uncharacterized membrane protein